MNEDIQETLATIKETLVFLVEQEKVRGEEVKALNDKIDAVNELVTKQIVEPAIEYYKEDQFNKFKDQYGERLGKYDDLMRSTLNEPDYDATREAWNTLDDMSEEDRGALDMDKYVEGVEKGISDYVQSVREKLGLPPETPLEIKSDGEKTEVNADVDGDGKTEPVATEEETETTETETEEGENSEVDPELQKELDAFSKEA